MNLNNFAIRENTPQNKLVDTLKAFKLDAKVVDTHRGYTVTRFEVALPTGTSYRRIRSIAPEIAGAMGAQSVTIVAPIPGKTTVGIDVTGTERRALLLSECWEDKAGEDLGELPIYIGGAIGGDIITTDLAEAPHAIVAGTTGSGKSVFLNALLCNLIKHSSPEDVALMLVDLKMVELARYNVIPHLMAPVVDDASTAVEYLELIVQLMGNRYKAMRDQGAENIQQYNGIPGISEKMKRIVVVIDELGDLMLSSYRPIAEQHISLITQKARAAGIHMVLCTQRPCSKIITGVIKANIPTRIAFTTASHQDSKVILDSTGAEKLTGMGDLLFKSSKAFQPIRAQAPYISAEEIAKIAAEAKQKLLLQDSEVIANKHLPLEDTMTP